MKDIKPYNETRMWKVAAMMFIAGTAMASAQDTSPVPAEVPLAVKLVLRWLHILTAVVLAAGLALPLVAGDDKTEAPETPANTLRWTTASEVDNFGFDVFRSDTEDGEFVCITADPIAGAGTVDVPTDYEFVDEAINPRQEYFYYVESISMSGGRERFTPVIRAPAKIKAAEGS